MNDRGENLLFQINLSIYFSIYRSEKLMDKSSQINKTGNRYSSHLNKLKQKLIIFGISWLQSTLNKWPSKSAMISWIRKEDNREKIGIDKPLPLLKELQDDAAKFKEFWRGNDINGNPVQSLNLIKSHASEVRQHIPLLMAASAGKYNKEDFEKLTIAIERLVFALKLVGHSGM